MFSYSSMSCRGWNISISMKLLRLETTCLLAVMKFTWNPEFRLSLAQGITQQGINPTMSSSSFQPLLSLFELPPGLGKMVADWNPAEAGSWRQRQQGLWHPATGAEDKMGGIDRWKRDDSLLWVTGCLQTLSSPWVGNMEEERISCPNRGRDVWIWKQKPPVHMGSSSVVSYTYTWRNTQDFQRLCVVFIPLTNTRQTSCLHIREHMCNYLSPITYDGKTTMKNEYLEGI